MTPDSIDDDRCRDVQVHLEFLGRRWSSGILLAAWRGARRFSEFRQGIIGISDRMLSVRLRELEREGLIVRTVVPTTPVQVTYALTARGEGLMEAMQPLMVWTQRNALSPVAAAG